MQTVDRMARATRARGSVHVLFPFLLLVSRTAEAEMSQSDSDVTKPHLLTEIQQSLVTRRGICIYEMKCAS